MRGMLLAVILMAAMISLFMIGYEVGQRSMIQYKYDTNVCEAESYMVKDGKLYACVTKQWRIEK